jgi:hypothetical protein
MKPRSSSPGHRADVSHRTEKRGPMMIDSENALEDLPAALKSTPKLRG